MLNLFGKTEPDELEPQRGAIDQWAPWILPAAMLVAKIAADTLAERNKALSRQARHWRAQVADIAAERDELEARLLERELADMAPAAADEPEPESVQATAPLE